MDEKQRAAVRAAMLSVYYHSIGSRLELRGAPAVLVPPEVEPLSLATALQALAPAKPRLREAIWTLARAVPPARPGATADHPGSIERYPRELREVMDEDLKDRLKTFDRRRTKYRQQAHLFSAALIAYAQSSSNDAFDEFRKQFQKLGAEYESLDEGTKRSGTFAGGTISDYLEMELGKARDKTRKRYQEQLHKLEQELGLSLATYVLEFADAVAFADSFARKDSELSVFPTSSITVQDARTLETQVTVTALVSTENFHCLRIGMDPQCWSLCSDAFRGTGYVAGPYDLTPVVPAPAPGGYDSEPRPRRPTEEEPLLLEEDVTLSWGVDETEIGSFHNILNMNRLDVNENTIDIQFDLNRSISSRILWDERAGGILVDEGYLKARPVTRGVWRVTTRKTIRFSDRTPYSGGPGWNDFGQVLNYLAPAALSWWIESELYSATCDQVLERARERQAEERANAQQASAAVAAQGAVTPDQGAQP